VDEGDLSGLQDLIANELWDRGAHCSHCVEAKVAKQGEKLLGAKRGTPDIIALVRIHTEPGRLDDVLDQLSADKQRTLETIGITADSAARAGSYLQMDHSVVHCNVASGGVEIMSTSDALKCHSWMTDYWWKALAADADKYTSRAALHQEHCYFIRALPGAKIDYPVQACLYIGQEGIIQDVIDGLSRLPGIGPKGAQRIAFHLLKADPQEVADLAEALLTLREKVQFCEICGNVSQEQTCGICRDPRRDPSLLCVVEESKDVVAIERTREFRGPYHGPGGANRPCSQVQRSRSDTCEAATPRRY